MKYLAVILLILTVVSGCTWHRNTMISISGIDKVKVPVIPFPEIEGKDLKFTITRDNCYSSGNGCCKEEEKIEP